MCVLGYNVNRGQEISLRLRTDDLRGFRKYARIRETLVHELAHMVWEEHDDRFKTFNSQVGGSGGWTYLLCGRLLAGCKCRGATLSTAAACQMRVARCKAQPGSTFVVHGVCWPRGT